MKFNPEEIKHLKFWMREREKVKVAKEAGHPKPWTKDSMLQQYRFCNVRREDDKVTRWLRHNWYNPNQTHPNLYLAAIMARLINWPPALEEIGFPFTWDYKRYLTILQNRKMRGEQIWTGAYMVTAGGKRVAKEIAVCDMVHGFYTSKYRPGNDSNLLDVWVALQNQGVSGMGSFLSAQIVADLKYTPILMGSSDWWSFCAPGPGSVAGLARLTGETVWTQMGFQEEVNQLRKHLKVEGKLCAQDLQNCLCEFSKYRRGFSRSKYPGV